MIGENLVKYLRIYFNLIGKSSIENLRLYYTSKNENNLCCSSEEESKNCSIENELVQLGELQLIVEENVKILTVKELKDLFQCSLQFELRDLKRAIEEKVHPMNENHFQRLYICFCISLNVVMVSENKKKNHFYLEHLENVIRELSKYENNLISQFRNNTANVDISKRYLFFVGQKMTWKLMKCFQKRIDWTSCQSEQIGFSVHFLRHLIREFDLMYNLKKSGGNIVIEIINLLVKLERRQLNKPICGKFKMNFDIILMMLFKAIADILLYTDDSTIIAITYRIVGIIFVDLLPLTHIIWNKYMERKPSGAISLLMGLVKISLDEKILEKMDEKISNDVLQKILPKLFRRFGLMDILINYVENKKLVRFIGESLDILSKNDLRLIGNDRFKLFVQLNNEELNWLEEGEKIVDGRNQSIDTSLKMMYDEMRFEYDHSISQYENNQLIHSFIIQSSENDEMERKENDKENNSSDDNDELYKTPPRETKYFLCKRILQTETKLRTTPLKIDPSLHGFEPTEVLSTSLLHHPNNTGSILKKVPGKYERDEEKPRNSRIKFSDKLFFKIYDRDEKNLLGNRILTMFSETERSDKRKTTEEFENCLGTPKRSCRRKFPIVSMEKENIVDQ